MKKYVISLKSRRVCSETPEDLASALGDLPEVHVVEGAGMRAVTVEIDESRVESVRERLRFANVSDYQELELL